MGYQPRGLSLISDKTVKTEGGRHRDVRTDAVGLRHLARRGEGGEPLEVQREKRREAVRRGYGGNAFSSHDASTLRRAETPSGYKVPDAGSPVWDLV